MANRLNRIVAILIFVLGVGVYGVHSKESSLRLASSGFVTVSGTHFVLDGKPFFVVGANNHYATFGTDLEVKRLFDDAVAMGANTLRIFLQPVIGSLDGTVPTIWDWRKEGQSYSLAVNGTYLVYWDPDLKGMAINDGPYGLQRVDRVIAEAKRRNLKLIIGFLDFWAYTGGAQQISAWYLDDARHPTDPTDKPVTDYRFFFSDPRTKRDYKTWVRHVLERRNPKTGLQYRADPTIMAWELLNEPSVDSDELRHQWTTEMSAFVKSIDKKHLVGTGSSNSGGPHELARDLVIPTIDYGTWHGYPIHDHITPDEFTDRIPRYCRVAAVYKKPMLLEEFGYARSNPDQVATYKRWLDTLEHNRDCAGWLVWLLVSRQQDGTFPPDNSDQFNVANDGSALWRTLRAEIANVAEIKSASGE